MGMMQEFKEFALKGNVVDMAVGIVIGAAFGKIVSSFVENIVMPPLGVIIGGVNFADLGITLKAATADAEAVMMNYGAFVQTVFDFVIVAFAIFMVIKGMNNMKKEEVVEEEAPAEPPREEVLLEEIRNLLAKQ